MEGSSTNQKKIRELWDTETDRNHNVRKWSQKAGLDTIKYVLASHIALFATVLFNHMNLFQARIPQQFYAGYKPNENIVLFLLHWHNVEIGVLIVCLWGLILNMLLMRHFVILLFVYTDETHENWFPKNSHYMFLLYFITCPDTFRIPDDVPADTGYVISAANSKPTGK